MENVDRDKRQFQINCQVDHLTICGHRQLSVENSTKACVVGPPPENVRQQEVVQPRGQHDSADQLLMGETKSSCSIALNNNLVLYLREVKL